MTATETEPLALTLGEAMRMLTGKGWWLSRHTDSWEVWGLDGFEVAICLAHELTWPEAVSIALGRPVVARDEAAELRAENEKLRAAKSDHQLVENIRTHLAVLAGYHDKSVHGIDMDVMRCISDLVEAREVAEAENERLRAAARAWLDAEQHTRIINAGATPEARRAYREAHGALKRLAENLAGQEERE